MRTDLKTKDFYLMKLYVGETQISLKVLKVFDWNLNFLGNVHDFLLFSMKVSNSLKLEKTKY